MHSSIFSFERPLSTLRWSKVLAVAILIFVATVIAMEFDLVHLGYRPTVPNSVDRWVAQRLYAKTLGKQGLIWIGASRGQLGIDLNVVRNRSGHEPVQLAIDGSSFVPVLKGLADDPTIIGTVIIDYQPDSIYVIKTGDYGSAANWEKNYELESQRQGGIISLQRVEKSLGDFLQEELPSYSDDANPLLSLRFRVLPQAKPKQFLFTYPDRSRAADYRRGNTSALYYGRVARDMGVTEFSAGNDGDAERQLRTKLATLTPKDPAPFLQGTEYVKQLVDKIEARGGKVIFVEMPTTGMVKEADDKFYPRAQFLEVFERVTGKSVLISNDTPKLKDFICPDGSHLDMRDRTQFTSELVDALKAAKQL